MKRIVQCLAVLMFLSVALPAYSQPVASQPAPTVTVTKTAAPAPVPVKVEPAKAAASQPVAAPAASAPAEVSIGKAALDYGLQLLGIIVLALLGGLARVLMKKYGLEAQSALVNDILEKAVGYAEQTAHKKLKLDGKPTPSAEKMKLAIDFAGKMAQEYKIKDKGAGWWEDKLEGWLGTKKVSG